LWYNSIKFILKGENILAHGLIYYYIIINIAAFLAMLVDKLAAMRHKYRIPEKWLLLGGLFGGGAGGLLGLMFCRHKINKYYFWLVFAIGFLLHFWLIFYVLD